MRIRTKLIIAVGLVVAAAVAAGLVLFWSDSRVDGALRQRQEAHEIAHGVFELNLLTDDYLLTRGERVREQWRIKQEDMARLLGGIEVESAEEIELLDALRADNREIAIIFSDLVANYQRRLSGEVEPGLSQEKEDMLVGTLLAGAEAMLSDANRLDALAWRRASSAQNTAGVLQMTLIALILGAVTAFSLLVLRSIVKPVSELKRGTEAIAAGDLDYRVGIQSRDELGDLSRSFDDMARKLKGTYLALEKEIEERTGAEEAVRESEARFRALVETSSDWVWEVDAAGRYTYASPKVLDLLGYEPDEVIGRTPFDMMPPEETERVGELFGSITEEKKPFSGLENANRHKDGRIVVLETSGTPVFDGDGNFAGYRGIDRDITERKQHEDRILRQSGLLLGINRVLHEALTAESDEDVAKICLGVAEELTASKFGFIGELDEKGLFYTIAMSDPGWEACSMPEDVATVLIRDMEVRSYWGRTIQTGESQVINDPTSDPDARGTPGGHPPITSFLGVPLVWGEDAVGLIALANKEGGYDERDREDVESLSVAFMEALQRKRAEMELDSHREHLEELVEERSAELKRYAEDLARSNRELEQFAYVASHDLQEPLRMISSYLQLLEKRYKGALDSDADEFIAYAVDGANRMQKMINDLLAFSRVGTRGESFEPADCNRLLGKVINDLELAAAESGAEVTTDPLPEVYADEAQLHQLFSNLLLNAMRFRAEEPPRIHVSAEREGGEWVFAVSDNGMGIEKEFQERIFEIFERLQPRADYPGTGIGLALARKIVQRHGGRIWVESEPGEGATFYFTLPAERR